MRKKFSDKERRIDILEQQPRRVREMFQMLQDDQLRPHDDDQQKW